MKSKQVPKHQSGVMLLEIMIAILIFAIGVLGVVGLQGSAVKQVTDAKYRSDACFLANQLIGTMWTGDRVVANMQNSFNSSNATNAGYAAWKSKVLGALPGVAANPPDVVVGNDGMVTVTVKWLAPTEPAGTAAHQYVLVTQIK